MKGIFRDLTIALAIGVAAGIYEYRRGNITRDEQRMIDRIVDAAIERLLRK